MNAKLIRMITCVFMVWLLLIQGCSENSGSGGGCSSSGSSDSQSSSTPTATTTTSTTSYNNPNSDTCSALGEDNGSGSLCTKPQQNNSGTTSTEGSSEPALTGSSESGGGGTVGISHTNWVPEPLAQEYMSWFFDQPQDPKLNLYVPGYAYFQGAIFAKGKTEIVGPIRVIGGVYSEGSGTTKLQKGAMITTDTEYLERDSASLGFPQAKNKFHVSEWEELPNN